MIFFHLFFNNEKHLTLTNVNMSQNLLDEFEKQRNFLRHDSGVV